MKKNRIYFNVIVKVLTYLHFAFILLLLTINLYVWCYYLSNVFNPIIVDFKLYISPFFLFFNIDFTDYLFIINTILINSIIRNFKTSIKLIFFNWLSFTLELAIDLTLFNKLTFKNLLNIIQITILFLTFTISSWWIILASLLIPYIGLWLFEFILLNAVFFIFEHLLMLDNIGEYSTLTTQFVIVRFNLWIRNANRMFWIKIFENDLYLILLKIILSLTLFMLTPWISDFMLDVFIPKIYCDSENWIKRKGAITDLRKLFKEDCPNQILVENLRLSDISTYLHNREMAVADLKDRIRLEEYRKTYKLFRNFYGNFYNDEQVHKMVHDFLAKYSVADNYNRGIVQYPKFQPNSKILNVNQSEWFDKPEIIKKSSSFKRNLKKY